MDKVDLIMLAKHDDVLRRQVHSVILKSKQTVDRMSQLYIILFQSVAIVRNFPLSSVTQANTNQRSLLHFRRRSIR